MFGIVVKVLVFFTKKVIYSNTIKIILFCSFKQNKFEGILVSLVFIREIYVLFYKLSIKLKFSQTSKEVCENTPKFNYELLKNMY